MRGEFELIALLRERIAAAGADRSPRLVTGSGDDAAVTRTGRVTVTSVDAVVDGVHFRRSGFPPAAIGAKALGAALSDIAAMGAQAGEVYVQVGLPMDASEAEVLAIADGLGEAAAATGSAVAGGDVTASPTLFLAVTAVGYAQRLDDVVTRAGASAGDVLVVSGPVGGAAAGLLLLENPDLAEGISSQQATALRERQLRPVPRLEAGAALAAAGATAMIDLSDGIAGDAGHLARASAVHMEVDVVTVPVQSGVTEVAAAAGVAAEALALAGGEDYELLAAVPADRVGDALAALRQAGLDPAAVGGVEGGEGLVLRGARGREVNVRGYDQLRSRAPAGPT